MVSLLKRHNRHLIFLFLLCCGAIGCSPTKATPQQSSTFQVVAGDFAPGQLQAHYEKHRGEFGEITIEEYLDNARALLNAAPGREILEKRRDNGDVLRYRLSSGEFAVMTSEGRIRTYFKADYRYWGRQ